MRKLLGGFLAVNIMVSSSMTSTMASAATVTDAKEPTVEASVTTEKEDAKTPVTQPETQPPTTPEKTDTDLENPQPTEETPDPTKETEDSQPTEETSEPTKDGEETQPTEEKPDPTKNREETQPTEETQEPTKDGEETQPTEEEKTPEAVTNVFANLLEVTEQTDTLSNFLGLFEEQNIPGTEDNTKPYLFMTQHDFTEWSEYLKQLEITLLPKWLEEAKENPELKAKLVSSLINVLSTEQPFLGLKTSDEMTVKDVLHKVLRGIYDEDKANIDLSGRNYVHANIEDVVALDKILKAIQPDSTEFQTDIYLNKLWSGAATLMNENFEDLQNRIYYRRVIYGLSSVKEKNILPMNMTAITSNRLLAEVLDQESAVALRALSIPLPKSTDEAISLVTDRMKSLQVSVDRQYDFYSSLDRKRLSGELLTSYQGLVDNRRGILASYYTGIYSPDYDRAIDKSDGQDADVRLGTSFELVALKLEEKGGDMDIRRSLYGLYDEKIGDSSVHKGLKEAVYTAYLKTPKFGEEATEGEKTMVTFESSLRNIVDGDFIDASKGNRVTISLTKNGTEVLKKDGTRYAGELEEETVYKLEMTARVLDFVNDLPDRLQLKWSYDDVNQEVIPNRYFFVSDGVKLTSKKNLELVHLDPAGDADGDGIPNAWELEGFIFDREQNHLAKYDKDKHKGYTVYYTSPVDWSSDGDPYSDLEEVIQTNTDVTSEPGQHPMVAAYPEYVVELEGITLNARLQSKYATTETSSQVNLNSSDNTTLNKYTRKTSLDKGFIAGGQISQSVGYIQGPVKGLPVMAGGIKLEGSASAFVSGKYGKLEDNEHVTTTIGSISAATTEDSNKIEALSKTTNSFKSADLSFNIRVKNIGSATGYDIKPNLSFYVGNEVSRSNPAITTVTVPTAVDSLAPGQSSLPFEVSNTETTDSGRKLDITINQETYEKILKGYPVTMQMNSADSTVVAKNETRGPWADYVNRINGISATINHQDAVNGLRKYKVFATTPEDTVRPQFTIGQSLENIYGKNFVISDETKDGKNNPTAKINGKNITAINVYADDISQLTDAFSKGATVVNFFNIIVRPGMEIQVETSDSNETKPFILNTLYKKGVISAYVLGNCSEVKSVKAKIDVEGTLKEVVLKQDDKNDLLYTYEFDTPANINPDTNNLIIAEDVNGNASEVKLYVAEAYQIREEKSRIAYGTTFKTLPESIRIQSKEDAANLVAKYPAESYVFYRNLGAKGNHQKAAAIYTKEEVLNFSRLGYALNWNYGLELYCQGYFAKGDEGDRFRPMDNRVYPLYMVDGQEKREFSITTGAEDATSYVVMIGATDRANVESGTTFTVNNRTYGGARWYSPILTNYMMIVKANDVNPETLTGSITVPNKEGNKKYDLQIVGYFTKGAGYRYKTLAKEISLPTMGTDADEPSVNDIASSAIVEKPKGYLLRVEGANTGEEHKNTHLEINGIRIANSRGPNRTGGFTLYAFVPNDANNDRITMEIINKVKSPVANYSVKILGYFY